MFCKEATDEVRLLLRRRRRQAGYLHGRLAAVTAPSAQLAVVPVPPGPDGVVLREAEGLGVPTATGDVDHTVALQHLHLQREGH